jgi:hypothetical protein
LCVCKLTEHFISLYFSYLQQTRCSDRQLDVNSWHDRMLIGKSKVMT